MSEQQEQEQIKENTSQNPSKNTSQQNFEIAISGSDLDSQKEQNQENLQKQNEMVKQNTNLQQNQEGQQQKEEEKQDNKEQSNNNKDNNNKNNNNINNNNITEYKLGNQSVQMYDEEYQVEKIVGAKKKGKVKYYNVKWMEYPESENTWEPEYNLIPGCEYMIDNFWEEEKKRIKELQKQQRLEALKEKKRSMIPHITDPDYVVQSDQTKNLNLKRKGKFDLGDVPSKVIKVVKNPDLEGIHLEIQWRYNKRDEVQPQKSIVSSQELRQNYQDILIEYYESRIIC